jgi:hypothetical protein
MLLNGFIITVDRELLHNLCYQLYICSVQFEWTKLEENIIFDHTDTIIINPQFFHYDIFVISDEILGRNSDLLVG